MRLMLSAAGAAALAVFIAGSSTAAHARFQNPALQLPSVAEPVACRVVRERVVRPGGRVIYRSRRVCTPRWGGPCRMVRERVVRPNGAVVYRSIRRC